MFIIKPKPINVIVSESVYENSFDSAVFIIDPMSSHVLVTLLLRLHAIAKNEIKPTAFA